MLDILDSYNLRLALGSIHPLDPQLPYPSLIRAYVINRARPGGIIILHDRKPTVEALEDILHQLVDIEGYKFVTLSELVTKYPISVESG